MASTPFVQPSHPGSPTMESSELKTSGRELRDSGTKRMKIEGFTRTRASSPSQSMPLSGTWILDKERSESLQPYLQLMGLSEMAIEAWTKAEKETDTFKVIDFVTTKSTRTGVKIRKRDRVQNAREVS